MHFKRSISAMLLLLALVTQLTLSHHNAEHVIHDNSFVSHEQHSDHDNDHAPHDKSEACQLCLLSQGFSSFLVSQDIVLRIDASIATYDVIADGSIKTSYANTNYNPRAPPFFLI